MARFRDYVPAGVIPATLIAFNDDMSIDEAETRRHLTYVAGTRGISAITVNGHPNEVHALTFEEQQRIMAFSAGAIGDKLPLINGVYADGSIEAARIAKMAEKEGASALLVFPPNSMGWGGAMRPEMALVGTLIPSACLTTTSADALMPGFRFEAAWSSWNVTG